MSARQSSRTSIIAAFPFWWTHGASPLIGARPWSLATLREKPVEIGARIVGHRRYVVIQLAEVAVPLALLTEIPRRIDRLRPWRPPLPP